MSLISTVVDVRDPIQIAYDQLAQRGRYARLAFGAAARDGRKSAGPVRRRGKLNIRRPAL
jgi:hypothetical protein